MDTRRDFIKKAALLSGATGFANVMPASIQKALAIDPEAGSTYLDAEHIVILMQENRSFDHCFGTLKGVRGFNDKRTITLPDQNRVWLQTDERGNTFVPFRLNLKDTKTTWMGSLPHSWNDQADARNNGYFDKWLQAKKSGNKDYRKMPLTLGYYNREDLPFYYSLADAFTICDQNFSSSLTGTTPNRLHLWTGTIRAQQTQASKANISNSDVDYDNTVSWRTFPELLEDNAVSWKIYQNEISLPSGLNGEEDSWLANFTDNPIEWFTQYNTGFAEGYQRYLLKQQEDLTAEIKALKQKMNDRSRSDAAWGNVKNELLKKTDALANIIREREKWSKDKFDSLAQRDKSLHTKAFTTNSNDPFYHELDILQYDDGKESREVKVPKGDVLYQFRDDVNKGSLPQVSWLVAPENFSDHPGAPWYGAWYVSEVMDILTKNPEVWKKTIFILAYDENDGYFDHIPPFVAPDPKRPETGKASEGIDAGLEQVGAAQKDAGRKGPIGLGYRVPLLVASPWSRGGSVCSQVFDHTSILQFLENFLSHKTGNKIEETNISSWRRTICGDLSTVFKPYNREKIAALSPLSRDGYIETVHKAKFKALPSGYKELSKEDIAIINQDPAASLFMPKQEKGIRPSSALPYQFYVTGSLNENKKAFTVSMQASDEIFKEKTVGAPFVIYAPGNELLPRNYAIAAGGRLEDIWKITDFKNEQYHLQLYGPNGFLREFIGSADDPMLTVECEYQRARMFKKHLTGNLQISVRNLDKKRGCSIEITDLSYKSGSHSKTLDVAGSSGDKATIHLDLSNSHRWYHFSVQISGNTLFKRRYAGRVETGRPGFTDPEMGQLF